MNHHPIVRALGLVLLAAAPLGVAAPASQPAAPAPAGFGLNNRAPAPRGVGVGAGGLVVNAAVNGFIQQQQLAVRQQKQALSGLEVMATYKPGELVRLWIADGSLRVDTPVGGVHRVQQRVRVEGSDALWIVNCQDMLGRGGPVGGSWLVSVARYDFDQTDEDQVWQTALNINNDVQIMIRGEGIGVNVYYQQLPNTCMLNVVKSNQGRQVVGCSATNLNQLHAEHPEEVRKYLAPMLKRLCGTDLLRPGAGDVYATFADLPADPSAAEAVAKLLPRLRSGAFAEREAATRDLARTGPAGVHAMLRLDRARLTEEQKARVDALIARERHRAADDDPDAPRHDVNFLADCLEDPDPAVRAAARACLEQLAGHPLDVDLAADPAKLAASADAIRKSLRKELDAKSPAK